MTHTEKAQSIAGTIAFIPYLLVAWGISRLYIDLSFLQAIGILLGLRLLFAIIEMIGGVLAWRLYGRRKTIDRVLQILREAAFPPRFYRHDDFSNYLARIENDPLGAAQEPRPVQLTRLARELRQVLELHEQRGVLAGMRMDSAAEAALEQYSPRASAPVLGTAAQ